MKIAVLDPGLERGTGHHGDLNLRLARLWVSQGHEVDLYGRTSLSPAYERLAAESGIRTHRTFRLSPYEAPPPGMPPNAFVHRLVDTMVEDLRGVHPDAACFWPTATPTQLIAHALSPHLGAPLAGLFYPPVFGTVVSPTLWYRAEQMLKTGGRAMRLGVYDEGLLDLYRTLIPRERVSRLPCPTSAQPRPFPRARSPGNDKPISLVTTITLPYLGLGLEGV